MLLGVPFFKSTVRCLNAVYPKSTALMKIGNPAPSSVQLSYKRIFLVSCLTVVAGSWRLKIRRRSSLLWVLIGFVSGRIGFVGGGIGLPAALAVCLLYCTVVHSPALAS